MFRTALQVARKKGDARMTAEGEVGRRFGSRVLVICLAVFLVGGASWWCYNRWFSERANPSVEDYPLRGIDISAHNGEVDFNLLKNAGVDFAYIKATEGADFRDRRFIQNAVGLRRVGIPAGAYHFFRFDRDGEMQGWNFINALKGRDFLLPPAVDVEEWGNASGVSAARIRTELNRMLDLLTREGYSPVVYSNKKGYHRYLRSHFSDYPLWICSFTDPPLGSDTTWAIWQFSHRGELPGIDGPVDVNTIRPSHPLAALIGEADAVRGY
ncbi:MAG: hypothetical protein HDS68_00375 [Bacteroidales bacterium]|nr:hypothetical protein [Bacteroidales bacterium]